MPPLLFPLVRVPAQGIRSGRQLGSPRLLRGFTPLPAVYLHIFGVTKDSAGAVLPTCDVHLFRTVDDVEVEQTVSDASGYYDFRGLSLTVAYYTVAYKAGVPDVAGTTVNTLIGS